MHISKPHFLLFSESRSEKEEREDTPGQWRFVLESLNGGQQIEAADLEVNTHGERLELLAVVRGLEALDQPSKVTLVTSSRYVTRGIRHGMPHWRDNGWTWECFGEKTIVKNCDLWKRVDQAMNFHRIDCRMWRFDPSHGSNDLSNSAETSTDEGLPSPSAEKENEVAVQQDLKRNVSLMRRIGRKLLRSAKLSQQESR